jgi:hypothetical protein
LEGEDEDMDEEGSGEGDFFDGEELSEVDIGDEDENQGEDEEEEMGEDEEAEEEYGMEDDDEDEYGEEMDEDNEDVFNKSSKKEKDDKKKKPKATIFADYDEFAHLLEGDLNEEDKSKKHIPKFVGSKRSQRGGGK